MGLGDELQEDKALWPWAVMWCPRVWQRRNSVLLFCTGSYLAKDPGIGLAVMHRTRATACAFHKLEVFWKDAHVHGGSQVHWLKVEQAVVQAILLYACATWALGLDTASFVGVFKMQCLRRRLRLDHVLNAHILARAELAPYKTCVSTADDWAIEQDMYKRTQGCPREFCTAVPSHMARLGPPKRWTVVL